MGEKLTFFVSQSCGKSALAVDKGKLNNKKKKGTSKNKKTNICCMYGSIFFSRQFLAHSDTSQIKSGGSINRMALNPPARIISVKISSKQE